MSQIWRFEISIKRNENSNSTQIFIGIEMGDMKSYVQILQNYTKGGQ